MRWRIGLLAAAWICAGCPADEDKALPVLSGTGGGSLPTASAPMGPVDGDGAAEGSADDGSTSTAGTSGTASGSSTATDDGTAGTTATGTGGTVGTAGDDASGDDHQMPPEVTSGPIDTKG